MMPMRFELRVRGGLSPFIATKLLFGHLDPALDVCEIIASFSILYKGGKDTGEVNCARRPDPW